LKPDIDKRTKARELAMQGLYQLDVQGPWAQGQDLLAGIEQFITENESDPLVRSLALKWTKGSWENVTECDGLIADAIIKWQLSRLSVVDKSILRLAVYQLKFCPDIPPRVAINEAIELAKKFSSDKSPSFVNGVLDAVYRKLRDKEK